MSHYDRRLRTPFRRLIAASAALATAVSLAACGDSEKSRDDGDQSSASAPTESAAATDDAGDGAGADADSPVTIKDIDTSQVLGEQTVTIPGTEDEITIGVHSLVVEDEVMVLRLIFTPNFASIGPDDTISLYEMMLPLTNYFVPVLGDRENLKEYFTINGPISRWSSDVVRTQAVNGEPMVWWGVYSAPQDDVDSFSLRVFDGFPEFENVPVS